MHSEHVADANGPLIFEVLETPKDYMPPTDRQSRARRNIAEGPRYRSHEPLQHQSIQPWQSTAFADRSADRIALAMSGLEHRLNRKLLALESKLDSLTNAVSGSEITSGEAIDRSYRSAGDMLVQAMHTAIENEEYSPELIKSAQSLVFSKESVVAVAASRFVAHADKNFARTVLPTLIERCELPTMRSMLEAALREANRV